MTGRRSGREGGREGRPGQWGPLQTTPTPHRPRPVAPGALSSVPSSAHLPRPPPRVSTFPIRDFLAQRVSNFRESRCPGEPPRSQAAHRASADLLSMFTVRIPRLDIRTWDSTSPRVFKRSTGQKVWKLGCPRNLGRVPGTLLDALGNGKDRCGLAPRGW